MDGPGSGGRKGKTVIRQEDSSRGKYKIGIAAVLIGTVLCLLTFLFISEVKKQLWQQSISTIMESTQQGCSTLRVQLNNDFESLGILSQSLTRFSKEEMDRLDEVLHDYTQIDKNVALYLRDGTLLPDGVQPDEEVSAWLETADDMNGIISPHISSVTGLNTFNVSVKTVMQDNTEGYLVKEYEVDSIVDSFTLSFYNDAGFSYVVNTAGDVLIRPPHPNSNKTVQNLFDMLSVTENEQGQLEKFALSLEDMKTGWAVFSYQGEGTVFCYTPLGLQSDWYLISIIPKKVVDAQTNQILIRTFILILSIIAGILILVLFYFYHVNKMNRRLRNQASYIGHLYNAVPEGIALITVDTPHRFIQLNNEGLRMLDYPADAPNSAPLGKYVNEVIHPDDYEDLEKVFQNTADENKKNIFENRVLNQEGGFFWAAGIVEKTLDENGDAILIATFHDITKEKLAEEAAKKENLQERMLLVGAVANVYPVIISVNLTCDTLKFIYVKPGLMVNMGGQSSYSELYKEFLPSVHPDYRDEFQNRFAPGKLRSELGKEKKEIFLEAKQLLIDGNYHWTSTQVIYVENPYSDDQLAILISRRIDEQRYEEDQQRMALQIALENARAANAAKSQFLSSISHDIRTPMNAIVGMTAIAAAHMDDRERVAECLKKINLSSKHLLGLINDVLDMSKIESGKLSLREEPFNLAEIVSEAVELVRSQADAKHLALDVHLSVLRNEKVIGDPLRISQVCINILSNAVKYTPAGGRVSVEMHQESSPRKGYHNYLFRCEDTGMGMDAEFLEKIFLPFERAQDTTSSKIMGTGLGMAITKNLIDMMDGDIQVESVPGEGSVFQVTFSMKKQDAEQEEVPEEWVGVRSIIVDDDRVTCEDAVELLEDMGLRAQFVTDGKTAVKLVLEESHTQDPFRLVIIDWKMPDMDGVEIARRIRARIGEEIPVIILTAYDWAEIESEARSAGVTAFLAKPFYRAKICYLLNELSGDKLPDDGDIYGLTKDFSGKCILLVEDNAINREIAGTLIRELGIQVEEACDGAEALEKIAASEENHYDLIFMDIQMPGMDGYETAKAVRLLERPDMKEIPIIAMTANAFEEDVRDALRAGMNAHFAKPIDVKALEELLEEYLLSDKWKESQRRRQ